MQKRGFTLIELLIVVAIIAILAAIAVPNFLEAQVRSKVARVKADMRALDTAMNAYIVDTNKGPLVYAGTAPTNRGGVGNMKDLSTPISYMTTAGILDPFVPPAPDINPYGDVSVDVTAGNVSKYVNYVNITAKRIADNHIPSSTRFVLISLGPDHTRGPIPNYSGALGIGSYAGDALTPEQEQFFDRALYDPSNGSISGGDILRYQGRGAR